MAYTLSAFKAYDVRGHYGSEIDERLCGILGYGIADWLLSSEVAPRILLACDVRVPNPSLIRSFLAGVKARGDVKVEFASFTDERIGFSDYPFGVCSTPMTYALAQGDYPLSVVFTASHNPAEDVGMKFFDRNTSFLSQQFLKDLFVRYESLVPELEPYVPDAAERALAPGLEEKKEALFSRLDAVFAQLTKQHTFCVDFSTGACTSLESAYLRRLEAKGHHITFLNDLPDGSFSAHLSETIDEENYRDLQKNLREKGGEFGLLFDGDGDRLGLVGPDGTMLGGDLLLAVLAEASAAPCVVYEVMCSQIVAERVQASGGKAVLTRMGRFFIKQKMEEVGATLGGETSGHIMFGEIGGFEMPLLALGYLLLALEKAGSWDGLMQKVRVYPKSPIMSFPVVDKQVFLNAVDVRFADLRKETIDGISVYGDDFWLNVRPSNTENKIRATVESNTQERVNEVVAVLKGLAGM